MMWGMFFVVIVLGVVCSATDPAIEEEEIRARAYLQQLNQKEAERANKLELANWAYDSNITDENLQNQVGSTFVDMYQFKVFKYIQKFVKAITFWKKVQIIVYTKNVILTH